MWEIPTFHKGGLSERWTPDQDGKYNEAAGVDPHAPREISQLNSSVGGAWMILRNQNFSASAGWTVAGGSSIDTTATSLEFNTVGSTATQALTGAAAYSSRSITLNLRCTRTGTNAVVRLGLQVNGALGTNYTDTTVNGSNVNVTHTQTLGAGVTSLSFYVEHLSGASTTLVGNDAAVQCTDAVQRSAIEYKDNLYTTCGAAVLQWGNTNTVFDVVFVGPSVCLGLGISPTDDVLIAGFGANGYYSTTDGTTWTARTGPGGPYASSRNRAWAVRDDDTVSSSVDVITPTWTDYDDIGTTARAVNGLFTVNDSIVVGKEDGLWVYDRSANAFRDITPEFRSQPHPDNCTRGLEWMGWLYVSTRRGLLRTDLFSIEEISDVFSGPQLSDFGGRLKDFAVDSSRGYALFDTPKSDTSTTKQAWLLTFKDADDKLVVYPIWTTGAGGQDLNKLATFYNGTDTHLYMLGRFYTSASYYQPLAYRIKIPARHEVALRDVTPDFPLSTSGANAYIITQYWDGLLPDTTKAFISLSFKTEGTMGASQTVTVAIQVDDDATWTSFAAVTATGNQTLYFSTLALGKRSGKRIRLRFTFATNSATAGPRVIMPIILHTTYRPARPRQFDFTVMLADELPLLNGGTDNVQAATLLTRLDGYLADNWPSTIAADFDEDGTSTSYTAFVDDVQWWKVDEHPLTGRPVHLYRIKATEKTLS